ncbi:MOSC domain-containing protein [Adhaeribacter radiodurans]|uniref:MOSC domain-containing protein n=1 Tax=Adhaeribacter radiodurans TaxID=2745197 RepID=A0A7L7LFR9_9BACT|nr:MOSC domain-containing protein [Adhaeribacter radiodurans]QMU31239.1 MOSC domain-containing protein [Adhaeribacter radiodurans]
MLFSSSEGSTLGQLIQTLPQAGKLTWIGIRPARSAPLQTLAVVEALTDHGLTGDHYSGKPGSKRQVTLIQAEHITAVASMLHRSELEPGLLRRNLVVQGINLLALKDRQFWVGEVLLEMTGFCHPCSRMETNLGPGGYNAMRGHGGITARILQGGSLQLGDLVRVQV